MSTTRCGWKIPGRSESLCADYPHREKWGEHYLFTEYDWAEGPPFGTAIPLRALDDAPPKGQKRLLAWLAEREAEHKAETRAAWKVILGRLLPDPPPEG
jgi:hypothetical protein